MKPLKMEFSKIWTDKYGIYGGICPLPVSLAPLPPEAPVCVHHGSGHRPGPASLLSARRSPRSGRNLDKKLIDFYSESNCNGYSFVSSLVRLKVSLS